LDAAPEAPAFARRELRGFSLLAGKTWVPFSSIIALAE
jgi:hypothetical protein